MILLMCLWHRSATETLFAIFAWPLVHYFFMTCLGYVSLTAHVSGCCQKPTNRVIKPCKKKMRDTVRILLNFTHSCIVFAWSSSLLISRKFDVESHALLQLQSLSFNVYSLYWNIGDFIGSRASQSHDHERPRYSKMTVLLHIIHNFLMAACLYFNLRTVSSEMHGWRNSVIDMMDLSMSWRNPTSAHRRVLSHHLLGKVSKVAYVASIQMLVHETPNIFYDLLSLLKLSPAESTGFQANTWSAQLGDYKTGGMTAASVGAAAWLRERGGQTGPVISGRPRIGASEGKIRTLHFLSFAAIRIFGGFVALRRILTSEEVVKDTSYICTILLLYGMALYLFAGVIAFTTKRMTRSSEGFAANRNFPMLIMATVSDEWLH